MTESQRKSKSTAKRCGSKFVTADSKTWWDKPHVVWPSNGGGFGGSRVGELAIGRASVILMADKIKLNITIIRCDPDEAGLIEAVHHAPSWIF
jgi:hypothetical protein